MIRPIILCGGAGTRLWPLSRALFPKHLLPITGEQSLFQQTALRVSGEEFAPAIVVTGEGQHCFIKRQLEEVGAPLEAIILEPAARNTAAAAALAAAWLVSKGRDDLILLMPSDHVILDREAYSRAIASGVPHAQAGAIVTFGAQPTEANTQYGYIEARLDHPAGGGAFPIAKFVEKPSEAKAVEYLAAGGFYWNAGIFLLKSKTLLEEMRRFLPESLEAITKALEHGERDALFIRPEAEAFTAVENISIDHGIMEKTSRGMVVPVHMDWSDVGAWDAVWKLATKDANGNAIQGDVTALQTQESFVRSEPGAPMIAALGLERIAIIATSDAVLVADLARAAEVKDVVERLKSQQRECVVSRAGPAQAPAIADSSFFGVNRIRVEPNEVQSFQPEAGRSKHWIVLCGSAEVSIGTRLLRLRADGSAYIPARTQHGVLNIGAGPVELIEVHYPSMGEESPASSGDERTAGAAGRNQEGTTL